MLDWGRMRFRATLESSWSDRVSGRRFALVVLCVAAFAGGMLRASPEQDLRAESKSSWIRELYPDYDLASGRIPSESSKVQDVLPSSSPNGKGIALFLIRVAVDQDKPLDCDTCSRMIDFALLGPDSKVSSFRKEILEMDGNSSLVLIPDGFYHGPHRQVQGVRIRRSEQGVESETLYLIDVRRPPSVVLEVQTHFSTCGAPGADETAGITQTSVDFHADSPQPIMLNTTQRDCQGHVRGRTSMSLVWDAAARRFVPSMDRP